MGALHFTLEVVGLSHLRNPFQQGISDFGQPQPSQVFWIKVRNSHAAAGREDHGTSRTQHLDILLDRQDEVLALIPACASDRSYRVTGHVYITVNYFSLKWISALHYIISTAKSLGWNTFCAKNITDRKTFSQNYFPITDTEFRIFRIN